MRKLVSVLAEHDKQGKIRPVLLYWDNGRTFPIDKIIDIRPAASFKCGSVGMRYTCMISRQAYFLFDEEGVWSIEKIEDENKLKKLNGW